MRGKEANTRDSVGSVNFEYAWTPHLSIWLREKATRLSLGGKGACMCLSAHVEVKGQLCGVSSLLSTFIWVCWITLRSQAQQGAASAGTCRAFSQPLWIILPDWRLSFVHQQSINWIGGRLAQAEEECPVSEEAADSLSSAFSSPRPQGTGCPHWGGWIFFAGSTDSHASRSQKHVLKNTLKSYYTCYLDFLKSVHKIPSQQWPKLWLFRSETLQL